jgi:hypothetical protein
MSQTTKLVVCALAITLFAGVASAQSPLLVDYFANAGSGPDGTLRITNTGSSGGHLCADIYVYDQYQELSECCSCLVTPNGLRTLSVDTDLTKDPLTGVKLATGSIRIISAAPVNGSCPLPTIGKVTPAAGIESWTTHIQNASSITETASQGSSLSAGEQQALTNACYAVSLVGSGSGICSCGTGD